MTQASVTRQDREEDRDEDPSVLSDSRLAAFRADVAAELGVEPTRIRVAGKGKSPIVAARILAQVQRLGRDRCRAVVAEALTKHRAEKGGAEDPAYLAFFAGWLEQAEAVPAARPQERAPDEPRVLRREGGVEYHV